MKQPIIALAVVSFLAADAAAQTASQITAFTGARTKVCWFTATTSSQELKYFDTDEGSARTLGTGFTPNPTSWNQGQIRISRSGRWVTASDEDVTYIFDISGTSPNKRTFLAKSSCTYWSVKAFGRDSVTGTEYAYAIDNFNHDMQAYNGTAIYRVPLNADGSANVGGATKITINSTSKIDGSIAVSADLKKIACLVPWPTNPAILDVATGRLDQRVVMTGCHANLAPDNSYRFFHLDDDHVGCYLFGANMSTSNSYISFGLAGGQNWAPRWTNHPRIIATTKINGDIGETYMGSIMLQKFNAGYTSFESSVTVVAGFGGEAWMANGYTGGVATAIRPAAGCDNAADLRPTRIGSLVTFGILPSEASVRVVSPQGRVVMATTNATIDLQRLGRGTFIVSAISGTGTEIGRTSIVR